MKGITATRIQERVQQEMELKKLLERALNVATDLSTVENDRFARVVERLLEAHDELL